MPISRFKKRPKNYKLGDNQSLAQKMARIRARIKAGGSYINYTHPEAPKLPATKRYLSPHDRRRYINLSFDADNPNRNSFTTYELQAMWIALCTLMAYYGGNRGLASREIGFSSASICSWIKRGRVSLLGAEVIGRNPEIPFSRIEMRPDVSPVAWKRFDRSKGPLLAELERKRKPK